MKTLHLHIGSPKTGTTSIQQAFIQNRKNIEQQGFSFLGEEHLHLSYFATKANRKDWPRMFKSVDEQKLNQVVDQYFFHLEYAILSGSNHQIISTECLFIDNSSYVKNYIEFMRKFFSKIKVYAFVRNPVDYYKSIQQQVIKARSYIDPYNTFYYKFKDVISIWKSFVDVEVIQYESGVNSFELLCEKVGIDFDLGLISLSNRNVSLSIQQMLLLEKIQRNVYPNKENKFKPHLGVIQQIKPTKFYNPKLKDKIKGVIQSNHYEDLEWINETYGIDLFKDLSSGSSSSFSSQETTENFGIRDAYYIEDEKSVEQYETLLLDKLLRKLLYDNGK